MKTTTGTGQTMTERVREIVNLRSMAQKLVTVEWLAWSLDADIKAVRAAVLELLRGREIKAISMGCSQQAYAKR